MTTRKEFIAAAAAFASLRGAVADHAVTGNAERGIRVRFLGSGASGWKPEWAKKNPNMRRQSSVLLENKVLIDFTNCSFDMLPAGCRPEVLFQRRDIEAAANNLGRPAPEVVALPFGMPIEECGLRLTGVPANHSTSRVTEGRLERTSLYLVEKGPARLLYATDTGGIPGDAARMIGIDPHIREENFSRYAKSESYVAKPQAITAFIMEATDGDIDDDFRMFVHSSVQAVARTVTMLKKQGRYAPPDGQSAYITHLGIKYRGWAAEKINAEIPDVLRAASDGLEVVLG